MVVVAVLGIVVVVGSNVVVTTMPVVVFVSVVDVVTDGDDDAFVVAVGVGVEDTFVGAAFVFAVAVLVEDTFVDAFDKVAVEVGAPVVVDGCVPKVVVEVPVVTASGLPEDIQMGLRIFPAALSDVSAPLPLLLSLNPTQRSSIPASAY